MKLVRKPWLWWCLVIALIVLSLIGAAYRFNWPGTGFQGKTVWDWLQLLIIPLALALIALVFNLVNTRTERLIAKQRYEQDKEIAENRYKQDQEIAKQRHEQDQKIALDKQREDLLQAYLDRMSELLLEKGLRTSQPDAEVRNVVRTRTISALIQLDAKRIGYVFAFLREAGLMDQSNPILNLKDADLSKLHWIGVNLERANLEGADLTKTKFGKAYLFNASLNGANLCGAFLMEAFLLETKLDNAYLIGADLREAYLNRASLDHANLSKANLFGADLSEAYLNHANLSEANLRYTDLTWSDLNNANLSKADLEGAKLKDAKIDKSQLTPEQIAQAIWD